jgi:hypothetical protein
MSAPHKARPLRTPRAGDRDEAERLEAKAYAMLEDAARLRRGHPPSQHEPPRAALSLVAGTDASIDRSSAAMRALAVTLVPYLQELLSTQRAGEALIDVCAAVPAPRRTVMGACRRGDVAGAVLVGRRWLAPQAGVDAWLRARGPRVVEQPRGDDDDLESVRRSLATPGRRRRAR